MNIAYITDLAGPDMIMIGFLLIWAFILWMLLDCLFAHPGAGPKIGWSLLIICVPLIGAVTYLLAARGPRRDAARKSNP